MPLHRGCKVNGCANIVRCKGLCSSHYEKFRKEKKGKICSVDGCDRLVFSKGMCSLHWRRCKLYNDPFMNKRRVINKYTITGDDVCLQIINLNGRMDSVLFDVGNLDMIQSYNWSFHKYVQGSLPKKQHKIYMHQLVMGGDLAVKEKTQIDHINKNTKDNRKSNLRFCTPSQNQFNAVPKNRSTIYPGVSKHRGKWTSKVEFNKQRIFLGVFSNPIDAVKARLEFEKDNFGEFLPNHHYEMKRRLQCPSI